MMYRKVLFLSFILFLLMGFACAENPVDADGFLVSNSSEIQSSIFSNNHDSFSSQSGLDEDDVHILSSTHVVGEGTFSGIEDAIGASDSGDTIYLGNKRYVGDGSAIHVDKNHLKFVGESKSKKATLDARGLGRIFNIKQATDITFKNIRFINGKYDNEGSGIISFGTVHIEDCEFTNNTGDSGTCIFLSQDADDSIIINCTFTNNQALYGWDGWAEGAAIDSHVSNTKIIDCTFKNNFAVNGGGAISLRNGKNNIIRNCIFTNNTSPIAGALYLKNTTAHIINSNFNLNHATDNRGGAIAISDSNVRIDYSNFTSNGADYGGAIYNFPGSDLTINHSNFIKNNADNGGCIYSNGALSINNSNFNSNECKNGKAIIYSTKSSKITFSSFTSNSKGTDSYLIYLNCDKNTLSNNDFESNQKAVYALNNNEISFNEFKNNQNGLVLKNNNKIYSNTFSGNDVAINSSNSNEISFNNFSNNDNSILSNNKNNILNNTFKNNKICVVSNESNTFSGNRFYNNSLALKCLKSNKISNNTFSYNEKCVQFAGSRNELFINSFSYNTIGIHLIQSNNNIIKSNSFSNNYQNSIKGTGSKNQLKGNNFTNNGVGGKYCNVYIKGNENKASNNIFKNNNYHALHFNGNKTVIANNIFKDTGNISLRVNGNHIKIKNNKFTGNKNAQIQVFGNNNQICKNIIKNGHGKGISINGNHNKIFKNKIKSNKLTGVYINGNRNNLTRNNITNSKKGIIIHGDKNIVFKENIRSNSAIGTHIHGNKNKISYSNITKSNKGLFIHGNRNNILQNVIKTNKIGVHNYKSKSNKINYNYIVNEKHNLVGTGNIDANYNWWGKNKLFKVSKSFNIKRFVVMYLTAPHALKFNKTYKINIRFKDNEDKKLKLSIPSLSTRQHFTGEINKNNGVIKANSLKLNIKVVKIKDKYVIIVKCDNQTLIQNYYHYNGKISSKKPQNYKNGEIKEYSNSYSKTNGMTKNNHSIKDFNKISIIHALLSYFLEYGKDFKINKSLDNFQNSVLLTSFVFKKFSQDLLSGKIHILGFDNLRPYLIVSSYSVGAFSEAFIKCNGDLIKFLQYPFFTIHGYKNLDKMGLFGFKVKIIMDIGLGIDENGNLSIGDLLLDLASVLLGTGVLGRLGIKFGSKLGRIKKLMSKFLGIENYLPKMKQKGTYLNNNYIFRGLSYFSSGIDLVINPPTEIASILLEKVLKTKNDRVSKIISTYLFNSIRDIGNLFLADYGKFWSNLRSIGKYFSKNNKSTTKKTNTKNPVKKSKKISDGVKKVKTVYKKFKKVVKSTSREIIHKTRKVVHNVRKKFTNYKKTFKSYVKKTYNNVKIGVKKVKRTFNNAKNSVKRFVNRFKFW